MSALAHPAPFSGSVAPLPRRRHLALVPAPQEAPLADVIPFPVQAQPVGRPAARPGPARQPARVAEAEAPLRLTVRGRRVLATLLVVAAGVVGSVLGAVVSSDATPAEVETITVPAGETLWGIASQVAEPGADVRDVVAQIARLNDLEGSTIVAGSELVVPARD